MNAIQLQLQTDKDITLALSQTDCTFDFIWKLADPENRIYRLKIILRDDLETAAFYKQYLLTTLRGYIAAGGALPAAGIKINQKQGDQNNG